MSNYNWCHNPDCHTIETQSRVRGSGDNKVLRTIKINTNRQWSKDTIWDYFCNNNCLFSFLNEFRQEVANIRPVNKPNETPIKVVIAEYLKVADSFVDKSRKDFLNAILDKISKVSRVNND